MIIDLHDLEGTRAFEFSTPASEIDLDSENVRLIGNMTVIGEVTKTSGETDVAGTVEVDAETDCTRCLTPVPTHLKVGFKSAYVDPDRFSTEKEKEVGSDDLDTDVLPGSTLDLKEVAREQILLNMPIQTFCKEDCKGLCPVCGGDRNLIDCNCENDETDPRWAALKNLK